ncbi:MAG: hypothetical protein AAFP17_11640 [Pseudomonadota bacterium]
MNRPVVPHRPGPASATPWRRRCLAATATALLALSAGAGAAWAQERVVTPQLCALRDGGGSGTVTLSTGCLSSSFERLDGSPAVVVDELNATVLIEGGFRYNVPANGIATTDCGGGVIEQMAVESLSARRYRVLANGAYQGVLDLTTEAQACTAPEGAPGIDPATLERDWKATDRPRWGRLTAPRIVDLLPRLVRDFPSTIEGRPTVTVEIARSPSDGSNGPRLEIHASGTGYPDDSVNGVRFVLLASPHPDGWRMDELWRQNLCARGERAGQWTADRCS